MPNGRRGIRDVINELIERTNSIIMRMRIVEQRNKTVMTKMDSLQMSSLEEIKESKKFIKSFEKTMKSQEERILQIETMLKGLSKKVDSAATKAEIKGLEHNINMYNPVKSQFVTKKELDKKIKEISKK
jgi:hypothetical protein